MKDINKKFSVRYYLNLVLVDEEERRYFKQQVGTCGLSHTHTTCCVCYTQNIFCLLCKVYVNTHTASVGNYQKAYNTDGA